MVGAILLAGCGSSSSFTCADDSQCEPNGTCEEVGYCSFPDETCGSGRRFGNLADAGIANACVPGEDTDSGSTGSDSSTSVSPPGLITLTSTSSTGTGPAESSSSGEGVSPSVCGDAIVDATEACDDGTNDGRYGGCAADCASLGPYCGDAAVERSEGEVCDDGNAVASDGCNPDCFESGSLVGKWDYPLEVESAQSVLISLGVDAEGRVVVAGGYPSWIAFADVDRTLMWSGVLGPGIGVFGTTARPDGQIAVVGGSEAAEGAWLGGYDFAEPGVLQWEATYGGKGAWFTGQNVTATDDGYAVIMVIEGGRRLVVFDAVGGLLAEEWVPTGLFDVRWRASDQTIVAAGRIASEVNNAGTLLAGFDLALQPQFEFSFPIDSGTTVGFLPDDEFAFLAYEAGASRVGRVSADGLLGEVFSTAEPVFEFNAADMVVDGAGNTVVGGRASLGEDNRGLIIKYDITGTELWRYEQELEPGASGFRELATGPGDNILAASSAGTGSNVICLVELRP